MCLECTPSWHVVVDARRITRFQVRSPEKSAKDSSSSTKVPGWENEEQISRSTQPRTIRFALRAPGYSWTEPLLLRDNSDVVVALDRQTTSAVNLRPSTTRHEQPTAVPAPLVPKILRVHLLTTVRRGTFVIYARTLSSLDVAPSIRKKLVCSAVPFLQ